MTAVICLALLTTSATADDENRRPNALWFEALGAGFLITLNYQRTIAITPADQVAVNVGIGPAFAKEDAFVPLTLAYQRGRGRHLLELGLGYTHRADPDEPAFAHAVAGYVYRSPRGWIIKVRLTPLLAVRDPGDGARFLPWAGVGVGRAF